MQDTKGIIRRPLDINEMMKDIPENPTIPTDGTELSSLSMFMRNSDKRTLFTFIELEGYPILRISMDGQTQDLILNNDQVKLLLRQMTLWLTR